MLETRVTFANSRGHTLVGDLVIAGSTRAVILSHGFASDRNGRGRLPALADALNAAGISTLRYDFAGCGESDDDTLTPEGLRDDLRSSIRFLQQQGFTHIGLYGHSLGGTISLWSFTPEIKALAVTGAATGPVHYNFDEFFPQTAVNKLRRTGIMPVPSKSELRPVVLASHVLMDSFSTFSSEELLSPITVPVLLIHGGGDDEERMLAATSREGIHRLPEGSVLEVFPEAPHEMHAIWPEVTEKLVSWFREHLG